MTTFSLDDTIVTRAVESISPHSCEPSAVADRFARAVWSGIAEPSDVTAGILARSLGPAAALQALVDRAPSDRVHDLLVAAGGDDIGEPELDLAFERWLPRLAANSALSAISLATRVGAWLLTPDDPLWPSRVRDLGPHEPLALWVRGDPESLTHLSRSAALVGARAATGYGEHMALELSAGLSDRGVAVVSGAAYGIDGMAHRGAIASPAGFTVALLAGGVDRFYPSGHDSLLSTIAKEGLVISELPCGSPPTKWRFLQRNRLIAALSAGTIVVEAGLRSGSLNTAAHAATVGRPLGAVPGPVTSPSSAGCHRLLREFDATCVTSADEIIELIGSGWEKNAADADLGGEGRGAGRGESAPPRRRPEQIRLLDAVSSRSLRTTADIASRAGLSIRDTQSLLGLLHLEGDVEEKDGAWISRQGPKKR